MSTESNKTVSKAISEFLKNLFNKKQDSSSSYGGFGGVKEDEKSADSQLEKDIESLKEVQLEIKEEVKSLIDGQDFLTAYMMEHQNIAIEAQIHAAENGIDATDLDINEIAREAESRIKNSIEALNNSDYVKEEFQDYHNHDAEAIEKATEKSLDTSTKIISESSIEGSMETSLFSLIAKTSESGASRFSSSPQSHAQNAGLEPNDQEIKVENERQEKLSQARQMVAEKELEEFYESEMGKGPSI